MDQTREKCIFLCQERILCTCFTWYASQGSDVNAATPSPGFLSFLNSGSPHCRFSSVEVPPQITERERKGLISEKSLWSNKEGRLHCLSHSGSWLKEFLVRCQADGTGLERCSAALHWDKEQRVNYILNKTLLLVRSSWFVDAAILNSGKRWKVYESWGSLEAGKRKGTHFQGSLWAWKQGEARVRQC